MCCLADGWVGGFGCGWCLVSVAVIFGWPGLLSMVFSVAVVLWAFVVCVVMVPVLL